MRLLLIILLLPFVSYGQTHVVFGYSGEYTSVLYGSDNLLVSITANAALAGISGASSGVPKEITGTGTTFTSVNTTLHGCNAVDATGFGWVWGNNTDGEIGNGSGGIGGVINATKITLDSRGLSLSTITMMQGTYFQNGTDDIAGLFWVKHGTLSDTLFYSGVGKYGMAADGNTGSTTYSTPTMTWGLPSGQRVLQMAGGIVGVYLQTDGTVHTWGGGGNAAALGRAVSGSNYAVPVQVTIPGGDPIVQIVGGGNPGILYLGASGKLYGSSTNSGYMGNSAQTSYNTPTDLTTTVTNHMFNGTTRTSITMMGCTSLGFYMIINDGSLFFMGDNSMGGAGNGFQANLASPPGDSTPWFVDPSGILYTPIYTPQQVGNKLNWTWVSSGANFVFQVYALDATNQLWSWGRNKGGVIPDGIIECPGDGGDLTAFYPNSWDRNWAYPVNPYTITTATGQGCYGCKTGAVTANCHSCGSTQTPVPVISVSGTTLTGTSSHVGGSNVITKYVYSQVSGPNTAVIDAPGSPIVHLSGLITGTYVMQLQVTDNFFDSATTTTNVIVGSQTGFYVSSSTGSDGNGGTLASPYASIAKAISSVVLGDTIYLKSGDTFNGTVYPITGILFEPYSTGAAPIVSGLTTLTGWTNEGGGIYGKLCTGCKVSTNLVITDGVVDHMARFPNAGYRTFTAINSTSFTDVTLPNSPSYIGGTAVLKPERYIIDTAHITGQSSGVVTIASPPGSTDLNGHGYFIENLFSLLDTANEFYINPATDTLYVFSSDPITGHVIQVSTSDTGFYFNHVTNVTVNGIKITGFNQYNIFTNTDTSIIITHCPIIYGGNDGVHSNQCVKCSYINDTIQYSNNNGVTSTGSNTNHKVYQSCQVSQNGLLPGMGHSGGGGTYEGINDPFGFATFTLCNVDSNGSSGLTVGGDSLNVFNNHCHHDGLIKSDGAEIYTHDASVISYTFQRLIGPGNICDHSFNDSAGVSYLLSDVNFGIYLDAAASSITVFNNTCSFNASAGVFNHGPSNTITNNNLFGNFYYQTVIAEVSPFTITGLVYKHNTHGFSTLTPNSLAISSTANDLSSFGSIDSNYYLCPLTLLTTLMTKSSVDGGTNRTLASWITNTTYDAHSSYLNSVLSYQVSVSGGVFSLGGGYKSATGTIYNGSITLSPYSSAILLPYGSPILVPFGNRLIAL